MITISRTTTVREISTNKVISSNTVVVDSSNFSFEEAKKIINRMANDFGNDVTSKGFSPRFNYSPFFPNMKSVRFIDGNIETTNIFKFAKQGSEFEAVKEARRLSAIITGSGKF